MGDSIAPNKLTREDIAKREIGKTDISVGLSWLVTVTFLLTLTVPTTVQLVRDLSFRESSHMAICFEIFRAVPAVTDAFRQTNGRFLDRVLVANRRLMQKTEEYEKQLEEHSILARHLLAPTQYWLTAETGLGNEKAYIGLDGWLFYRPDVDYLTGPGFLDPTVLRRRSMNGKQHQTPPQPDPRVAILEFHEQLARRGIRLILVPVPDKAAIHPEKLSSRFGRYDGLFRNTSFPTFQQELKAAGVLVFDPAEALMHGKDTSYGDSQFLRTDTHWTPDAMQFVAEKLSKFIDRNCPLPSQDSMDYRQELHEVENLGDIAAMLHLPENQALYPQERVMIREIRQSNGGPWASDKSSDVLLLGDSYTNIYSLPEMNWGASAGLAEQLSFILDRRIDRLSQNDGGSHTVRQALYQELAHGQDRLAGKRVVIWEFAVRELAFGDWKSFPMPDRSLKGDEAPQYFPDKGELDVGGTIRAVAGVPQPGSVPYRDAVTGIHLDRVEGLEGSFPSREILVYVWGMRDNRLLPTAKFVPGQKVRLRVTRWDAVRDKYERFNRIEPDDPDFKLAELPIFWAEEAQ